MAAPAPARSSPVLTVDGGTGLHNGQVWQRNCGEERAVRLWHRSEQSANRMQAVNGLFYGDGKGCSKTCIKEPNCLDSSGKTQACTSACGDGNLDPGEDCDDGTWWTSMVVRRSAGSKVASLARLRPARTPRLARRAQVNASNSPSSTVTSSRRMSPRRTPGLLLPGTKKSGSTRPRPSAFPTQAVLPRATTRPHAAGASWLRIC